MNITGLINKELESSIRKYGEDNDTVKFARNIMKKFGYKVLAEINRLNFTAFTVIDDDDLSSLCISASLPFRLNGKKAFCLKTDVFGTVLKRISCEQIA